MREKLLSDCRYCAFNTNMCYFLASFDKLGDEV